MLNQLFFCVWFYNIHCLDGYPPKPQPCGSNEEWNKCAVPIFCELKCGEDAPKICPKVRKYNSYNNYVIIILVIKSIYIQGVRNKIIHLNNL